ncbi:MAG: hypothetical protein ACRDTG_12570 [Pseudonocardiaceae bacterium]
MPTYEKLARFDRDFARLTRAQQEQFFKVIEQFIADLRASHGFRAGLRVKRVQGAADVWELTWAPDGRATWEYGPEQLAGEPHIIWRRIGTHDIFRNP